VNIIKKNSNLISYILYRMYFLVHNLTDLVWHVTFDISQI